MNPNPNSTDQAVAQMLQSFAPEQPNDDVFGAFNQAPQPIQPQQIQPQYQQQPPVQQQPQYMQQQMPQQIQTPTPQYQQPIQQGQGPLEQYPIPQQPQYQQPAQSDAVPAWAQGLVETVQGLQQQAASAQGGDWKPSSFNDIDARIAERAQQIADQKIQDFQTQQQQAAQQEQLQMDEANKAIDASLANLHQIGYLPPIMNPNDPNDAGRQGERELIAYAVSLGTDNLSAVAPQLKLAHDAGYFFDHTKSTMVRRGSQTAAANAPIAGASPSVNGMTQAGPSQRELATMDMTQLMTMGLNSIR